MNIPVIVSTWVTIYIEYIVKIISFHFTVYWFLITKEEIPIDADGNGDAGLFGELSQVIE